MSLGISQHPRIKRADLLIATTVLGGLLLTWLVLTGLDAFTQFATQIGNIGHNGYTLGNAAAYILLTLPRRAYQWFVFAALIGGLIGIGALASPSVAREPTQWKVEATFEAAAATPVAQWPGALRAPQCMVEGWSLPARPDARAYLLTSRGFGMNKDSHVWLQMELVIDGDRIERHWRRVAARPF